MARAHFDKPTLICIVGPTAVGKSSLAIELALRYQTDILSADARQLYQELSIGTAKPSPVELAKVTHHFVDQLPPSAAYSAAEFEADATSLLGELFERQQVVVMAGGSTLYTDAIWYGLDDMPSIPVEVRDQLEAEWEKEGLTPLLDELSRHDPTTYAQIDRQNPRRVLRALEVFRATGQPISHYRKGRHPKNHPFDLVKLGLTDDRARLYARIDQRVASMMAEGLEAEVKGLLAKGYDPQWQSMQSIGYREFYPYFEGEYALEEVVRLIQRNSRRYAKRQLTYWRREQDLHWFEAGQIDRILNWLDDYAGRSGKS